MKSVVIGSSSGASMEQIMSVYPRHNAVVDRYIAQGVVLGIGPFTDRGNMAIFKTCAAAEAFMKEDPFALEGLVKEYVIGDWDDRLLPIELPSLVSARRWSPRGTLPVEIARGVSRELLPGKRGRAM